MPVMDGYQATAEIRSLETDRRTPIIALTANVLEGDQQRCLQAGMDDFLGKPFSRDHLVSLLEKWIDPSVPISSATVSTLQAEPHNPDKAQNRDTETQAINTTELVKLKNIMKDSFTELVTDFIDISEKRIEKMNRDAEKKPENLEALETLAHNMKSSSAYLSAQTLSTLAEQLELACRDKATQELHQKIQNIESEFQRVKQSLTEFQSNL